MAWLTKETKFSKREDREVTRWKIAWRGKGSGQEKRTIRLSSLSQRAAEAFKTRFEELVSIHFIGAALSPSLVAWIDGLDPALQQSLVTAGLVPRKQSFTVGELVDTYREGRKSVSEATSVRDRQVCTLLVERFGRDAELRKIGRLDAERFREWLKTQNKRDNRGDNKREELAENTVRRRTGGARQIFACAVRWGWIDRNPFEGLACSIRENPERQQFIPWETIARAIDFAPLRCASVPANTFAFERVANATPQISST